MPRDAYGDAVFTQHWNDDRTQSWITCDRADPRIRLSYTIAEQAAAGELVPAATLTLPSGEPVTAPPARPQDLVGAVLAIDCANRRLVYRITGWEPVWLEGRQECGSYLAEECSDQPAATQAEVTEP